MDIAGVACVVGFVLLGGMLIGSVVVRTAVAIANQMIGPVKEKWESFDLVSDWDWDEEPEPPRPGRKALGSAIPMPGFGKGMMIASAANVLTAFIGFLLGVMSENLELGLLETGWGAIVLAVCAMPFGFAGLTVLLIPMLPTTFWRSAQVAFIYHLTVLGLLLTGAGGLFALDAVLG